MRKLPTVLLALVSVTPIARAATPDEAAVHTVNMAWGNAYASHDGKTVASLYAEDAVLFPDNAPEQKGLASITAYFAKDTAYNKSVGVVITLASTADTKVSGDMAWESGLYTASIKGKPVGTGKFLTVFHKTKGKWLIVRDIWNTDGKAAEK